VAALIPMAYWGPFFVAPFVPGASIVDPGRKSNPWLWVLTVVVTWHALEHMMIMWTFLKTGVMGSPGLLASGGAIAGGLPLTRPDLHFLYNLIEETLIVIAYVHQIKHLPEMTEHVSPEATVVKTS
jgi:hypothetical protein